MVRKFFLQVMLCIACLLCVSGVSEAAFQIKIDIGSSSETITDTTNGSMFDTNLSPNQISATFTANGYKVTVTQATTNAGQSALGVLNIPITVTRINMASEQTVTITTTSDGFNFTGAGSTVTFKDKIIGDVADVGTNPNSTFILSSNVDTIVGTLNSTSTPGAVTISKTTTKTGTITNNSFTISDKLIITNLSKLNGGVGNADFDGTVSTKVTEAIAVPVPPALALLASGVPFALVYLRRRKTA